MKIKPPEVCGALVHVKVFSPLSCPSQETTCDSCKHLKVNLSTLLNFEIKFSRFNASYKPGLQSKIRTEPLLPLTTFEESRTSQYNYFVEKLTPWAEKCKRCHFSTNVFVCDCVRLLIACLHHSKQLIRLQS